jgi:hypothetical protein
MRNRNWKPVVNPKSAVAQSLSDHNPVRRFVPDIRSFSKITRPLKLGVMGQHPLRKPRAVHSPNGSNAAAATGITARRATHTGTVGLHVHMSSGRCRRYPEADASSKKRRGGPE